MKMIRNILSVISHPINTVNCLRKLEKLDSEYRDLQKAFNVACDDVLKWEAFVNVSNQEIEKLNDEALVRYWDRTKKQWKYIHVLCSHLVPTHWMPTPNLPEKKS